MSILYTYRIVYCITVFFIYIDAPFRLTFQSWSSKIGTKGLVHFLSRLTGAICELINNYYNFTQVSDFIIIYKVLTVNSLSPSI